MRGKILTEYRQIAPAPHHAIQHVQRLPRVRGQERSGDFKKKALLHTAEHVVHVPGRYALSAKGEALIGQRQRIPHAAVRRSCDQRQALRIDGCARALQNAPQIFLNIRHRQAVKIKALAAGDDRGGELLRFGGGENEHNVGGRLLQRFQERVEGGVGQHVRFVHDEYAVRQFQRRIVRPLDQRADVVHAVVAGRVNFRNVRAGLAQGPAAGFALAAGLSLLRGKAVDSARQNLRRAGLAGAARTAEQIGMRGMPRTDLVLQNGCNMPLPDDLGKSPRPVGAVQRAVCHGAHLPMKSFYYSIPQAALSKKARAACGRGGPVRGCRPRRCGGRCGG